MTEYELGRAIARQVDRDHWRRQLNVGGDTSQLAQIGEVFRGDQVAIGQWSEGLRKLDVEWVIRLSPEMISRWFGYLSVREAWPVGESERRWAKMSQEMGIGPVYIVILSAFPKKEMLGFGDSIAPSTEEIENVRIVFDDDGRQVEAVSYELLSTRAKSRSDLDALPWWQFSRLDPYVTMEFEKRYEEPMIPRGDYHRSWRWVVPNGMIWSDRVTVKILSRRKIRSAHFSPVAKPGI